MGAGNVGNLLNMAGNNGTVSQEVLNLMTSMDIGAQINNGLGITPDNVASSDAILIAMILDNSGSIRAADAEQAVCDGQNIYVDAFSGSKAEPGIMMATWLVNEKDPVQPFVQMSQVIRLENGVNYRAIGGTPLYERICVVLSTMLLKMKSEFFDAGISCKGYLLVVSDGQDEHSDLKKFNPKAIKKLLGELGEDFMMQFMGINGKGSYSINFEDIALEMGVQKQNIITTTTNPHDIRQGFGMGSKSAKAASKATNLNTVVAGGFAATTP